MKNKFSSLSFAALFILPLLFYPAVSKSGWISSSDVHALLEFASSLLAITAGIMVLLHFFTTGRWFFLIISIGFVLIGSEELVHSLFSYNKIWPETPLTFKLAVSSTWLAGQLVLTMSFFIALIFGKREIVPAKRGRYAVVCNSIGLVCAAFVTLLVFNFPLLPDFVRLGTITKKLTELSLAFLYFVVFLFYSHIYLKQQSHSPLFWSIIACIIFRVLAHIFVFDAHAFYDSHWDTAHLIVFLSYFFPIFGVWGETIKMHKFSQLQLIELEKEIAARKRVEKELNGITQRLQLAASSAKLGIWDWDTANNIMVWDDRIIELYGLTRETFQGGIEVWQNGLHPEDRDNTIEECQAALRGEKEWDTEFRVLQPNGTVKHIKANGIVIRDPEGNPIRMLGINIDITEYRKLETQLLHSQKMEAIGAFAGGIAHDFNNILTAIIGYASVTQMKMKEDDPLRHNIDQVLASSEYAANLTKSLLAFSRKQINFPEPVDLNEIIKKVKKFLIRIIGEDVELNTILADRDLTVMADSGQIEQILMNLAANARDAMPKGGALTIRTETVEFDSEFVKALGYGSIGKYVCITISDTGVGIDASIKEKIFEPFFTTKEVGKGTGLGLSIVYGIIKQHDGYINCYSEAGKGTTFKIYLPMLKSMPVSKVTEGAAVAVSTGGTETILLAEDEESVRKLIKEVLEESGYKVIEAANGKEAVNKFMENKDRIDLLLLDIIMPKISGKEAYERIAKIKPGIKAIFSSGYPADFISKQGIIEEGLNFVTKPISPTNLLKKIREVLDK